MEDGIHNTDDSEENTKRKPKGFPEKSGKMGKNTKSQQKIVQKPIGNQYGCPPPQEQENGKDKDLEM